LASFSPDEDALNGGSSFRVPVGANPQ
jgi:hypothetical protein